MSSESLITSIILKAVAYAGIEPGGDARTDADLRDCRPVENLLVVWGPQGAGKTKTVKRIVQGRRPSLYVPLQGKIRT